MGSHCWRTSPQQPPSIGGRDAHRAGDLEHARSTNLGTSVSSRLTIQLVTRCVERRHHQVNVTRDKHHNHHRPLNHIPSLIRRCIQHLQRPVYATDHAHSFVQLPIFNGRNIMSKKIFYGRNRLFLCLFTAYLNPHVCLPTSIVLEFWTFFLLLCCIIGTILITN